MARTDNLTNYLTDVIGEVKIKKGDNTPIKASELDTEIANLPTGGGSKFAPAFIRFNNYSGTTGDELDLENLDTSNINSMREMFTNCSKLTTLDLSNFNTSNVTDMGGMFRACYVLKTLNINNFVTDNVTDMSNTFSYCYKLSSLDLNNFNTSKVIYMGGLFNNCRSLVELNVSTWNTSNVTDMRSMFFQCIKLTNLDLSNFDTSKVGAMDEMFTDCMQLSNLKIKIANCNCDVSSCPLTAESVAYILQNLGSGVSGKTLTLGATNLALATQEDLDSATAKGWTVN